MPHTSNRMPLLDALKGIAAQLILVHHLVSYGPLAEAAGRMFPGVSGFLFDYGRMVVQVFLVIAGFLATQALVGGGAMPLQPFLLILRRYRRLAVPFVAAMAIAVVCSAIARPWLSGDVVPAAPTLAQFLAHALLLHGVLDVPSLSAGVWYVAIDLQLFALLVLILWLGQRVGGERHGVRLGLVLMLGLALASLFHFNRDDAWDAWAVYFFAAYALGAAAWLIGSGRFGRAGGGKLATLLTIALIIALFIDFRLRIVLAALVALGLGLALHTGLITRWPRSRLLDWLGRVSYAVFLVHFPVLLLFNAAYGAWGNGDDIAALAAMIAGWAASLWVGALFHRHIEQRRW